MILLATILLVTSGNGWCAVIKSGDIFKLNIIHYNDFHARYEETSLTSPICQFNNASCLGGFPRLYHHINTLIARKPDAILLNAGDSFQGTFWYTLLKWNITQQFMNLLPHDAHAIGNHDFDDGPAGLAPYLRALNAPALAANLDSSNEPILRGTYKPSIVVERHGRKIGIIGLITVDTEIFADPGKAVFTDPGEATRREAEALTKQGVDIIVLLSHCGLDVDKQLARDHGQYIDVIVGGHTHSLLWNGVPPSGEPVAGPYPIIIENEQDKKHKVLIVQAACFTKYMGDFSIYFDDHGDYMSWEGGPVYLDRSIPEDLDVKKKLEPYAKLVHEAAGKAAGHSLVSIDSKDCNIECGMGDVLTDAIVEYAKDHVDSSSHYLAFVASGNIASKIDKGVITEGDLFDVYPYLDRILHFEMKGEHVKKVLETSVTEAESLDPFKGPWLQQVSGLQVTYNVSRPEGARVTSAVVTDGKSSPLDNDTYYHILTAKFATYFGKGFSELRKYARNVKVIGRDRPILEAYIKKHSPLSLPNSGRIVINN